MIPLKEFETSYPVKQAAKHLLLIVWISVIALHVVGRIAPVGTLGTLEAHSYALGFILAAEVFYRWAMSRELRAPITGRGTDGG